MGRKEILDRFSDRSFSSNIIQNALAMSGKARFCTGNHPSSSPTPISAEDNLRTTDPKRWYRVGGGKGVIRRGSAFAEQVWPANAEEFNPPLIQLLLLNLAEVFRRKDSGHKGGKKPFAKV